MNSQFKKGVLELVVLAVIAEKDRYGYEIINLVEDVMDVNEGTIYPLLKRLTNEHYFETYLKESTEGPPRKYYRLTGAGALQLGRLKEEWFLFTERIEKFLKEVEGRDQGNLSSKAE
ncbi:PadR family transcriptional regulator [Peptococcus simiae]|uniref:PadR family transcriptional regulator n=1 Tax=Peptococcus simiae TaxID=1643805 RepID=UPI00397FA83A